MSSPAELQIENLEAWRDWLRARHSTAPGAWLITSKKSRDHYVPVGPAAELAACFGWRHERGARLDEDRVKHLYLRRGPFTPWRAEEKVLVRRLALADQLERSGIAAVARSRRNGSWRACEQAKLLKPPLDVDRDALPWWTRRSFVPRDEPATAPTVETKIQRLTGRALERVHRTHGVAVIRGPSGIGKRHAARTFQARPGAKAAMIQPLDPRSSP